MIVRGHCIDLLAELDERPDLIVTDPPYAFGGTGDEHAISATVATALRESFLKLKNNRWGVVFCASSWRSIAYMVEAVRGVAVPVRVGTWVKPSKRSNARTASGWGWASVEVLIFKKGRPDTTTRSETPDWISEPTVNGARRAQLPQRVAEWAVEPYVHAGGLALDPFAGSGALVSAAETFGMRGLGFEVQES